jgi:hypothetical protein
MSRFDTEQPGQLPSSPMPDTAIVDEPLSAPQRQRWYRWHRDSENKEKSEKRGSTEEIDYVEEVDGVWGKLGEGAPNYKNVGW